MKLKVTAPEETPTPTNDKHEKSGKTNIPQPHKT